MYKNLVIKFFMVYIVLVTTFISFFYTNHQSTVKSHLNEKKKEHYLNYKAVYNEHKTFADIIFNTEINVPEVIELFKKTKNASKEQKEIIRKKLYEMLKYKYGQLKSYNLRQLHFHLPNNESFLRLHRPNIYGDNLTSSRLTVKYANANKEYVEGFEEGKIFNGFRFVYPLFDFGKNHIGSVEISFGALAFLSNLVKTYNVKAQFLIKKSVVDKKVLKEERKNYIQSPYKNFYYEKSIYSKFPVLKENKILDNLEEKLKEGKPFSVYLKDLKYIKTFIPLKNAISKEVVAVLCICEKDSFMLKDKKDFYLISVLTAVALALIFYFSLMQKITNERLKKINKELDKRVELEIRRNRKKDASILNHAKMGSIAEMLSNIAHQWRQPLNVISTSASGLMIHKDFETLDDDNFKLLTESILEKTEYLSKTIDNFREYLDDNTKESKKFEIQNRVEKAIDMIEATFEYNNISIKKNFIEEKLNITGNVGEFIQIILNILNNAKEALIKNNNISNRNINIDIKKKNDSSTAIISIGDNAGGVPKEIMKKIFDPYFTTKHEAIGTGISLYMCYEIITKNFKGKIYVKNRANGAKFYIEIPLV